jgi:hypothetical protein
MVIDPTAPTLYDDWKARRARLAEAPGGDADCRAVEMQLLDYLLRRYEASPEAARAARFPAPMCVFVDHRAIVVHHHLGRGLIPNITNEQEARNHVRGMVDRMWSRSARKETAVPAEAVASCTVSPPAGLVEAVRTKLCDSDPLVRVQAALKLGQIGDLDDIGLLSDLLSLPASSDEHPREREAILYAMQRLSGATTEVCGLYGVLPETADQTSLGAGNSDAGESDEGSAEYDVFTFLVLALALIMLVVAWVLYVCGWLDR